MKTNDPSAVIPRRNFLRLCAFAPLLPAGLQAQPDQKPGPLEASVDLGNLRAFVELARSDIRTQKALIVAENIDFTPDEAVEFWPLHRQYETELNKLLDQRYAGILQFASQYETMTDAQATALARKAFDLEGNRTNLKRKYFKKFAKVIPPLKAARFFQIENQLNMALDLHVAASLPLIK